VVAVIDIPGVVRTQATAPDGRSPRRQPGFRSPASAGSCARFMVTPARAGLDRRACHRANSSVMVAATIVMRSWQIAENVCQVVALGGSKSDAYSRATTPQTR
jgi:hypothetical protein